MQLKSRSMVRGSQSMTRVKSVETLTSDSACVDAFGLPGWGHRDPPKQRLKTIGDMTRCRSQ